MTTFQQRALTAVIFAAVMLTGLFFNDISFFLLFSIISIGCLWEFLSLMFKGDTVRRWIGVLIGASYLLVIYINNIQFLHSGSLMLSEKSGLVGTFFEPLFLSFLPVFILLIIELFEGSNTPFQNVANMVLGFIYTIVPFSFLIHLTVKPSIETGLKGWAAYPSLTSDLQNPVSLFTPHIVAGILFLTWANDTFAYLIGSKIGKTPLLPRISPKKTWEGTIGGALMCMLTGVGISYIFKELSLLDWAIVGGIVAVFGTLGDLVESMLKRSVGVKDSGSFMPGHGGFLDRFDAFIFALPFVYVYLRAVV